jgi:hypothetical protein
MFANQVHPNHLDYYVVVDQDMLKFGIAFAMYCIAESPHSGSTLHAFNAALTRW